MVCDTVYIYICILVTVVFMGVINQQISLGGGHIVEHITMVYGT